MKYAIVFLTIFVVGGALCQAGNKEDEPCATGDYCDDCNVWSEVNGVRYCCANNCDYGSVSVEDNNGEVVCHCSHDKA